MTTLNSNTYDPEKGPAEKSGPLRTSSDIVDIANGEVVQDEAISSSYWGVLGKWSSKLENLGVEARGIQPVLPSERSPQSIWGLSAIWASAGLTMGTLTTGILGPWSYNLTFGQTTAIIWGCGAIGAACDGYLATFGKKNGMRALINSRYAFGYYGAMVMAFLNNLTNIVYGILACIQGGQSLNTLSQNHLPTIAGIVIVAVLSWFLGAAGYKYIHFYERVAWIGPLIAFIALYAVGAPHFATSHPAAETLDPKTQAGNILTYISIITGSYTGWVAISADYYIYFPVTTPSWQIFLMSFLGILVLPAFAMTCGAGFATALWTNEAWAAEWDANGTVPGLVEVVLRPLGPVRYFFIFILAWSMISNNVFNYYSVSITMQLFGKGALRVPRYVYTLLTMVIMIAVSIAGRNSLYNVLSDLMAIIGYWSIIYFVILAEEHLIFRSFLGRGWDLNAWNDKSRLPSGLASIGAFCIGAVGSILGMSEAWYVGVVGRTIGEYGGDLGIEMGFLFAGLTYPLLRWLELKFVDR
ncbi:hypothetical protein BP5796_10003 [Coleophoma crateriformis]|uniref:Purine-cytosine permease n=1 Tax=Coleophoma crateriformis TaxID=565419 RepID=A0A3D8QUF1_9HELO|nr:hypothetical protein BP5796_10003 [Coleophoma crateriformis]